MKRDLSSFQSTIAKVRSIKNITVSRMLRPQLDNRYLAAGTKAQNRPPDACALRDKLVTECRPTMSCHLLVTCTHQPAERSDLPFVNMSGQHQVDTMMNSRGPEIELMVKQYPESRIRGTSGGTQCTQRLFGVPYMLPVFDSRNVYVVDDEYDISE